MLGDSIVPGVPALLPTPLRRPPPLLCMMPALALPLRTLSMPPAFALLRTLALLRSSVIWLHSARHESRSLAWSPAQRFQYESVPISVSDARCT